MSYMYASFQHARPAYRPSYYQPFDALHHYEVEKYRVYLQPAFKAIQDQEESAEDLLKQLPHQLLDQRLRGTTLLSTAVLHRNIGALESLLQRGVDTTSCSQVFDREVQLLRQEPPLITAARTGFVAGVEALALAKTPLELKDATTGKSALHWACVHDLSRGAVRVLAQLGADPNSSDKYLETPMTKLIRNQDMELVKTLLENGYQINQALNYHRETALIFALSTDAVLIAKYLICAGADVNVKDRYDSDVLQVVLKSEQMTPAEQTELCRLLLMAGLRIKPSHIESALARNMVNVADLLKLHLRMPNSLMNQCRVVIRNYLSICCSSDQFIIASLETLPIPQLVKKYLALII